MSHIQTIGSYVFNWLIYLVSLLDIPLLMTPPPVGCKFVYSKKIGTFWIFIVTSMIMFSKIVTLKTCLDICNMFLNAHMQHTYCASHIFHMASALNHVDYILSCESDKSINIITFSPVCCDWKPVTFLPTDPLMLETQHTKMGIKAYKCYQNRNRGKNF